MEFQQDCPKDKKITALNFLAENLEKFRSTERYGAALEGSTIFLCHSSLQVRTSQNRCEVLFFLNGESHALQIWPTPQTCVQVPNRTSLETLRPSEVVESALCHASVGVRCEMV